MTPQQALARIVEHREIFHEEMLLLMRSIMNREGSGRLGDYTHVAAQIDPEEGRFVEVDAARRFLEKYFVSSQITIYWGSVEDFLRELGRQWDGRSKSGG